MIDAMGGLKSQNYDLFRNIDRAYNCLEDILTYFIFYSLVDSIKPIIKMVNTQKYIRSQIIPDLYLEKIMKLINLFLILATEKEVVHMVKYLSTSATITLKNLV